MARAYGANAQLLGKFRSGGSYGDIPVGNYIKLPFISCDLGSEQGLIASDVLGQGREPQQPSRDVINANGNIVVPVDLRNFGHWLRALLGDPTTAGAGPYTHTFTSGKNTLPDLALEIGMPEVPAYYMVGGVMVNTMELEFIRSGGAQATFGCLAQGETRNSLSQGGTPTEATFTRFNQFQGSIKRDGDPLGNVTRATLTYSNGMEAVENIRNDGKIDGIDPTIISATGEIVVRFADTTLEDDATNGTPCEIELAYTIDADKSLVITLHEVYLPKAKKTINGPGGIQATYAYQAARDSSTGISMTVVLTNDVASYTA